MIVTKTRKDLKAFLKDPKTEGIDEPYFLIKADDQVIVAVSTGLNGQEFNKTEGFWGSLKETQFYQCLYGQGLLLMQRNGAEGEAKEFKVIALNPNRRAVVPIGWVLCLVNIGKNFLVVMSNLNLEIERWVTKSIREKHGLAYYVVEKRGEVAFEQNPYYSIHPQITTE